MFANRFKGAFGKTPEPEPTQEELQQEAVSFHKLGHKIMNVNRLRNAFGRGLSPEPEPQQEEQLHEAVTFNKLGRKIMAANKFKTAFGSAPAPEPEPQQEEQLQEAQHISLHKMGHRIMAANKFRHLFASAPTLQRDSTPEALVIDDASGFTPASGSGVTPMYENEGVTPRSLSPGGTPASPSKWVFFQDEPDADEAGGRSPSRRRMVMDSSPTRARMAGKIKDTDKKAALAAHWAEQRALLLAGSPVSRGRF